MVVAALLLPLLVLNALGGTAVLAQCDEGNVAGLHLHAVGFGAETNETDGGAKHDHDGCGGDNESTRDESAPTPDTSACPFASVSDHLQLAGQRVSSGGVEVGKVGGASGATTPPTLVFALLISLTLDLPVDSPGWGMMSRGKPLHLSSLSTGGRLIRVNRALLI